MMIPTRARRSRALHLLAVGGIAFALTACAPDSNSPAVSGPAADDGPLPDGPAHSAACEAAFPDSPFGADMSEAHTVPADWATPDGVELCGVFQSSDTTAVLQYATSVDPDALLDAWEPLLGGYTLERSEGIGGWPILNAAAGDLEFAIQTDGEVGAAIVGFSEGAA
jgi:hypothetical protein